MHIVDYEKLKQIIGLEHLHIRADTPARLQMHSITIGDSVIA